MIVWNLWEWVVNLMGIGIALVNYALAFFNLTLVAYAWYEIGRKFVNWAFALWWDH